MLPSLCRLSVGVQPSPAQPGGSGLGSGTGGFELFEYMSDDTLVTVLTKADCSSATKLCEVLHCQEGVWEDACRERGWAAGKPGYSTWKQQFEHSCTRMHTDDTIQEAVDVAVLLPPPHMHPFYGPIAVWDVSEVTEMNELFLEAEAFNGDLSRWDVSKVTDMSNMFTGTKAFNGDLSRWDVSTVKYMSGMFTDAIVFDGDLSRWDVSNVTNMAGMFLGAEAFNGDLSRWDVSNVTLMTEMFSEASAFSGDLSRWDIGNVTNNIEDVDRWRSDSDYESDEWDWKNDMFPDTYANLSVHKIGSRASLTRPKRPLEPLLPDRSTWPQWPAQLPPLLPLPSLPDLD